MSINNFASGEAQEVEPDQTDISLTTFYGAPTFEEDTPSHAI